MASQNVSYDVFIQIGLIISFVGAMVLFTPALTSRMMSAESMAKNGVMSISDYHRLCNMPILSDIGKLVSADLQRACNQIEAIYIFSYIGLFGGAVAFLVGMLLKKDWNRGDVLWLILLFLLLIITFNIALNTPRFI